MNESRQKLRSRETVCGGHNMDDRTARYAEMLKRHIYSSCGSMTRGAAGVLKYPYIAPTSEDSPYYSHNLWDWDSWLTGITFAQSFSRG